MPVAPKKYVKINGVMKLNPEYKKWKDAQNPPSPSAPHESAVVSPQALPVVTNMQDHEELNEIAVQGGGAEVPLAESTNATIEMIQEPEICIAAGMSSDTMVDELGAILDKYEVPMGLMNKLMMLSEYDALEFIIDDSGSMGLESDTYDRKTGKPNTRWQEARIRLKEMVEIVAYVPFQTIAIIFLNRADTVLLQRNGRDPKTFLLDAYAKIDGVFAKNPSGSTPALEKLQDAMIRGANAKVCRYFFGDGTPNGGQRAQTEILNIVKNRQNPQDNPLTFISCTNEDEAVEWMKDIEEIAPYVSEADDYRDEAAEVLRDQGVALPFTRGFHLVCSLAAAFCPDDLDAMDESVPFTKTTLDNLLGIQHDEASYRHYFTCFQQAQQNRTIESKSDQLKKNTQWNYADFLRAPVAREIPQVRQFQSQIAALG